MSGNVWEVVGGQGSGGITVRSGKDLKSPEAAGGRLSHGALVAELALEGERLRFSRLTGTGPNDGWVSLSFKGKALVAKAGEPGTQAAAEAAALREAREAKERGERAKPRPGRYKLWLLVQGSRGDVQPILALAVAARKAGWVVRLLASEESRAFVESYGIDFSPVGFDLISDKARKTEHSDLSEEELRKNYQENQKEMLNEMVASVWSTDALIDLAGQLVEEAERAREADDLPDALFFHPLAGSGAYLLWAKYRFPIYMVDFVCAPLSSDADLLGYMHQMAEQHGPLLKARFGADPFEGWDDKRMLDWKRDRTITCASRLQLSVNDVFMQLQGDVVAYLMSRFTGPLIMESASQMQDLKSFGGQEALRDVQKFLDAGDAPVYAGWGSMPMDMSIVARVLTNAKFVKLRVIILGGWAGLSMEGLVEFVSKFMPEDPFGLVEYARKNVLFLAVAPHEWLFQRCCLTIHHGGAGTTQAALRAGVPTIVTPYGADQFMWADFVVKLGCGQTLSLLDDAEKLMNPAWTKALRKASSDAAMIAKAKEVGESIRQERGTAEVLDRIKDGIELKARGENAGCFGV